MTKTPDSEVPPKPPPKSAARQVRDARLAQALRDNLRRRKAVKTQGAPRETSD
jgi:hypothetical protein